MDAFVVFSLAFLAAWFIVVFPRWSDSRRRRGPGGELPPGPPPLPIVGNILQLRGDPHKSFAQLAKTYGPLMSLRLGTQFAVVVSSPEMATEILQKHGHAFSNRSIPDAINIHGHNEVSWNTMPADSTGWKRIRRVGREKLFSHQALQQTEGQRQERLRKLADHVRGFSEQGRVMNVGEATFTTMTDLVFSTLFSIDLTDYGATDSIANKEFKEHVNAFTRYIGVPNISDFFPIFAPLDPQGIRRKIGHHLGSLLAFVQSMIEERLRERKASTYQKKNDFLDTLLDISEEGNGYDDLSIKEIRHFCVDIIVAGSDTSAATTEWAMVELLLHPDKLAKLKAELKSFLGEKSLVEGSDISKLPYLQATIKEVFRFHPAAPLLGPREAVEETQINGYTIPKNAKIMVNFWAMTRDPSIWKNPESFEPERFLGKDIDYEGQHFELIPFGSGRRICPGMPLASRMLHCMVATLCHNFDWELEGGAESKQRQREDVFGLALQKKFPLRAKPIKV
uniref:Carnosic acid synthase n=1 Tax=Rosmarinus officinalis TaxID=39367 RepID=C76K7_ROSOF|nr:RecName: Full=Carnosic acid synthase; AltName: Full=Cytochrome P450 76AK7; Short=RoCYP76AK7; AltName: Full=Miltiradien-20-al synthase; AltName: Full=Pisiferic acid synthase [Salvia rosmarinus]AOW42545.1 cytochrome P450 76AK7 [Salvia rosmarinus]